jgi:DNA-directed RNA polymerase I, II, and III subunit RPABC2
MSISDNKLKSSVLTPVNFIDNQVHKIDIITPDAFRMTSEILTVAEYTRVISERASHITQGSKIFIDIGLESDPINIAKAELRQKQSPMQIRRYTARNIIEIWSVNDMVVPFGSN